MAILDLMTILLPVATLFCLAFAIYALRSLDHMGIKVGLVAATVILLATSILLIVFGGEKEPLMVDGIKSEYTIDDFSQVHITGKISNVTDYNKMKITVLENGKPAADNVITTVYPSKNRLKVSYTSTRNENSELRVVVSEKNETVAKKVDIKKAEKLTTATTTTSSTTTDKGVLIKGDENRVLNESAISSFTQEAKETTKRFNKEVREDSLSKVEINPDEGVIVATFRDTVQMLGHENKTVLAEELGTRVVGLYKGTVIKNNSAEGEELPIKVVYEDGSPFGKSTKEDPKKIVLVKSK